MVRLGESAVDAMAVVGRGCPVRRRADEGVRELDASTELEQPAVLGRARRRDVDPASLEGKQVRVRGVIETVNGRPQIAIADPAQIEVLN